MNTIPASMAGVLGAGHRSTDRSRPALLSFQNFLQFHQQLQQQLLQVQQQQQQQALFHGLGIAGSPDESRSIESSSPNSIPDVNYVADVIAQQLLPFGADLFNNKQDANCVLVVENRRYFVHVQMLAVSRAPLTLSPPPLPLYSPQNGSSALSTPIWGTKLGTVLL
jgi:hypothetical protein